VSIDKDTNIHSNIDIYSRSNNYLEKDIDINKDNKDKNKDDQDSLTFMSIK
jgi:hypothetical protein